MNLEELFILWLNGKGKNVSVCGICKKSIVTNHDNPTGVCNSVECWRTMFISKTKKAIDNREKEIKQL